MILNDKIYTALKWICLIFIPAVCTLIAVVLPTLGVSHEVTGTVTTILTAVATFIGALIGISNKNYYGDSHDTD